MTPTPIHSLQKEDILTPCMVNVFASAIYILTGTLNPKGAVLMSCVASVANFTATHITQNSQKVEDQRFRLAAATLVPLTFGVCIGLPLATVLLMTITDCAIRILLHEYFRKKTVSLDESV